MQHTHRPDCASHPGKDLVFIFVYCGNTCMTKHTIFQTTPLNLLNTELLCTTLLTW